MSTDEPRPPETETMPPLWELLRTMVQVIAPTHHLDAMNGRSAWVEVERWVLEHHGPESDHLEALRLLLDPSPWGDLHRELVSALLLTLLDGAQQAAQQIPAGPGDV